MEKSKNGILDVPKLDFSSLAEPMSDAEVAERCAKLDSAPKRDWRKFVEDVKKHPELLLSWDADISFDEFARRVRAGEYD